MTREHKLALIVGFALVLVLGVLISDHFSKARQVEMAGTSDIKAPTPSQMGAGSNGARMNQDGIASGRTPEIAPATERTLAELPGVRMPLPQDPARASERAMGAGPIPLAGPVAPFPGPDGNHDQAGQASGQSQTQPVQPPLQATPQIPMTRYDVKEGDTLYRIASKTYGDGKLWEKIRDFNKDKLASGGTLHQGVTLLLPPKDVLLGKPYVPQATTTLQTPTPSSGTPGPTATMAGNFKEYVVKEGDTLVGIARKQLNSARRVNDIIEANKGTLADPESLSVGMKLRIPAK